MDKTIAFSIIGFFVLCACVITWATIVSAKRNNVCLFLSYSYAAVVWISILLLLMCVILY